MIYSIDYNTGVTEDVRGTLDEAKAVADGGAAYTQCDISICDERGTEVCRRRWNGVAYTPEETEDTPEDIIDFGDFGYFGAWE